MLYHRINNTAIMINFVTFTQLMSGVESPLLASDVTKALMDNGVLVVPAGPRVVRFVPPLIISEAEVSAAMSKLDSCLGSLVQSK